MTPHADRLAAVFGATTILTDNAFRFGDGPPVHATEPGPQPLAEAIWPVLYTHAYAREYARDALAPLATAYAADAGFVDRASAALASRTRWDSAWSVYRTDADGALHLQKGERFVRAQPGRYVFRQAALRAPVPGDLVDLMVVREAHDAQPGFHYVFGETVPSDFDEAEIARYYFHARADGVAHVVGAVSARLNRYAVPFRLKFLNDPNLYDRSDAVVMYAARRFAAVTQSVLATSRNAFARYLRPSVPLFAKALMPGVGAADDPATGESFGQSRCKLVAEAIVDAWRSGSQSSGARFAAVRERFRRAGLSFDEPHLAAGAADVYALPAGWGV